MKKNTTSNKPTRKAKSITEIEIPEFNKVTGEITEVKWFNVQTVAEKYNSSVGTIYRKIKEFEIPTRMIASQMFIKDDSRFAKQEPDRQKTIENSIGQHKIHKYVDLSHKVDSLEESINELGQRVDRLNGNLVTVQILLTMNIHERKEYAKKQVGVAESVTLGNGMEKSGNKGEKAIDVTNL